MGCDIYSFAEVRKNGKWIKVEENKFPNGEPFSIRSYGLFGFLADVRNYSKIPSFEQKGFPDDSEFLNEEIDNGWGGSHTNMDEINECYYHSKSHLALKELLDFDFSKTFENRRTMKQTFPNVWNGAYVVDEGEGEVTIFKDFLDGTDLFPAIEILIQLGKPEDVRIIFYFDK